jgi:hypothetical protein
MKGCYKLYPHGWLVKGFPYANDVALFIKPIEEEMQITKEILKVFGDASGLQINIQKSNIIPINCVGGDLAAIHDILPGTILEFPCKYLGLPLSNKKLIKCDLMP